jgi:hypothetical protein
MHEPKWFIGQPPDKARSLPARCSSGFEGFLLFAYESGKRSGSIWEQLIGRKEIMDRMRHKNVHVFLNALFL